MAIRLSGLNSGMDTDSIVQALMSAQNYRKTKIEAKQTKLEWKKDLWSELNTKIYNFYTNTLGKMRLQGTFKTKAATSSDNSKVTATATSSATEGTYKVKVNSLASAQYVTSGKLNGAWARDKNGNIVKTDGNVVDKDGNVVDKDGNIVGSDDGTGYKKANVSGSTKLVDLLGGDGKTTFAEGTQIVVSGKKGTATLLVDENTKVSDFVKTCQNAGLTASFDADQQRFFIGSDASGADQGFTITSGALSSDQLKSITEWKEAVGYNYLSGTNKEAVNKIFDKLQAGTIDEDKANESLKQYVEKSKKAAVNAYYKKEVTDKYNNYFEYKDANDSTKKTGITQDGINALLDSGKTQAQLDKMSDAKKIEAVNALVNKKVAEELKTQTYQDKISDGIENGIVGASDVFLSVGGVDESLSEVEGKVKQFVAEMDASKIQDNSAAALAGIGLGAVDGSEKTEGSDPSGMVVKKASDASISFNGATLTSSTSTLTVNGLTLNILDTTPGSEISISVTKDTSAIYDTVKDFISEYNDILKTMNSSYNAASAKGYDVLTDEQKEAMTDSEIEKWEDKIKSSLLRRDSTLNSIISSFKTNMMGSYTASDGKRYSLASLGITTSAKNWYEGGLLHIKGDEDDEEYMDENNKLETMLTKDPELVMEILNGITGNLYTDLQKKMGRTSMSSALTFYNDKEMNSQLSDYKKQISNWEKKLATLEERYYSQFTAMEKAMASLNSQQNYFSSMMG